MTTSTRPVGSAADGGRLPSTRAVLQRCEDPARGEPTHFNVGRQADPEMPGGARRASVLLLSTPVVVADHLERPVERRRVVTAVEQQPGARRVGEGVGRDEVPAPDLRRVDAEARGQGVHRPLDRVGGLGTTGAAVRVGRRLGGEHPGARERVSGDVVAAVVQERAEQRDAGRDELQVGPHVGEEMDAHRGHLARRVGSQLDVLDLTATVDCGHGVLAPVFGPRHGLLQAVRQREREDLLGVHVELGPEGPTNRGSDDPQLVLGQTTRDAEHDLQDVRDLRRRVDRELTGEGLGHHAHATRLHGRGDEALLHVPLGDRMDGIGERGVDRRRVGRQLPGIRRVGPEIVVEHNRVGQRFLEIDDRRQRVVVDDHRFRRVARLVR